MPKPTQTTQPAQPAQPAVEPVNTTLPAEYAAALAAAGEQPAAGQPTAPAAQPTDTDPALAGADEQPAPASAGPTPDGYRILHSKVDNWAKGEIAELDHLDAAGIQRLLDLGAIEPFFG